MTYADTDFFLALLKPTDWLRKNANQIFDRKNGQITTSETTYIELMLLSKRYGLDPVRLTSDVMAICNETSDVYPSAADLISQGVGVFDYFHAAHSDGEIISPDSVYDKPGIKRIDISNGIL